MAVEKNGEACFDVCSPFVSGIYRLFSVFSRAYSGFPPVLSSVAFSDVVLLACGGISSFPPLRFRLVNCSS
jgi:hypothetical protein